MSDEKSKKRKNTPSLSREGRGESPKEHKRPWQEMMATPQEIKAMLSERVLLRYNEVRGRTEMHRLSQGPVIGEDEQGLLTIFGGDEGVTDGYQNLGDRDINTLWEELYRETVTAARWRTARMRVMEPRILTTAVRRTADRATTATAATITKPSRREVLILTRRHRG